MTTTRPLTHQALFWLKNSGDVEDRAKLIAGVRSLSAIPQVKSLHVGVPASTEARDVVDHSWAVSETMTFDSVDDQTIYQTHPIHQKFIEECSCLWSEVRVIDIVDAP